MTPKLAALAIAVAIGPPLALGAPDAGTPVEPAPWYARPSGLDLPAWLRQHAVRGRFPEKVCFESPVGVPLMPGLICRRSTGRGGWSAPHWTFARVYQLRGRRLVRVFEGPVATWRNWVDLTPSISEDGATLTLSEARPGACQGAYEQALEKLRAGVHDQGFVDRVARACAARGRYRWEDGRYRREGEPATRR